MTDKTPFEDAVEWRPDLSPEAKAHVAALKEQWVKQIDFAREVEVTVSALPTQLRQAFTVWLARQMRDSGFVADIVEADASMSYDLASAILKNGGERFKVKVGTRDVELPPELSGEPRGAQNQRSPE